MSMRNFSKKALAIVLSVAMLASCMVFSFSATAAETLMWENDFSNGSATNWKAALSQSDNAWASGNTHNKVVYDEQSGAMKLSFTGAQSWAYMAGFGMFHKEATTANNTPDTYGYNGGENSAAMLAYGAFRPAKGEYRVTFDYKVESFSATAGAQMDLCVGFAARTAWKWWGSGSQRAKFIDATNNGVYDVAATVDASTEKVWKQASLTISQPLDEAMLMHVFARNHDGADKNLDGSVVLIDNVKVYKTSGGSVTPPPSGDDTTAKKLWQNTFDSAKATSTNWKAAYTNTADNAWYSNSTNNAATYDATNGAMELSFKSATAWTYLSGFTMFHEEVTNGTVGSYGYHGGETSAAMIGFGAFRPAKGAYTVTFDYKVTDFSATEGAAIDLCVGFATRMGFKWYGDKSRATFIDSTNKGVYSVAATVTASDKGADWKTATVTLDQPLDEAMLMHVFARTSEGVTKDLNGSKVLVDNVTVYEGTYTPVIPDPGPSEEPDPEGATRLWDNNFNNGTNSNWKVAYTQSDNAWYSNGTNNKAAYDDANKAMALSFNSSNSWMYLSGFTFFHKEATNGTADSYGYHGGETSAAMIGFGAFRPAKGSYMIKLSYKVDSFSTAEGASIDLCVGFANRANWKWYSSVASRADFINSTNGGVYDEIATITAADKEAGWQTATLILPQTSDTPQLMHIFARTSEGVSANLAGSKILVDNVVVYKYEGATGFVEPDDLKEDLKIWFNNYNNGTADNWMGAYGREDKAWSSNQVINSALYNADEKAMELAFKGTRSEDYMSGFTVFHQDTTHGQENTAGYHGGEDSTAMLAYGAFRPSQWKYTVKFKYKVTAFSEKAGASMDLCVGFADRSNWKWWGDMNVANFLATEKGNGFYAVAATVTAGDLGKDWQTAEFDIVQAKDIDYLMQFFATGSGTTGTVEENVALSGSKVLIDDIEIYKVAPDEDFTNISFFYNGAKIGQSKKALPGMKFEMPILNLPAIPSGSKVVYYADAACTQLVDTPAFYPAVSQELHLRIVQDTGNTWGFETEPTDTKLSLNTDADIAIHTDGAQKRGGAASARVNADGAVASKNQYPQMLIKNGFGKQVTVGKNRDYEVRFYVYVPAGESVSEIKYWLTATNDESAFDEEYDSAYSAKKFMVAEGATAITAKGEWVEVRVRIEDCDYAGKLRLGIIGDASGKHVFYVDDVLVLSLQSDPNAWGFETEQHGKRLSVNDRIPNTTIYVDDSSFVYTGSSAARVNSDGGAGRTNHIAQMMVKNGAGEQVRVYQHRNYEITFYVYVPDNQPEYNLTYWFTATERETVFDRNFDDTEYSRKNFTVAEGTSELTRGEWNEIVVTIIDCPYTGKLRIGLNGNSDMNDPFYIDDLLVKEATADTVDGVESFETYGDGHKLSLGDGAAAITVTDDDRHNGEYAAEIVTVDNNVDSAPQMIVNDDRQRPIVIEKGKSYSVTFWVTQPINDADYDIKYWFAATDSDTAFTNNRQNIVLDTQTVVTTDKHAWQKVKADIIDAPYSGKLRLGITASEGAHTFYIDDVFVKEVLPADMSAMNFENYEIGTNLSLNSYPAGTAIIISDEQSYSGGQSAYFNAKENTGDNRPHMNVKDAYGNQVKVKKGDNFYVSFMVYIPETEPYFTFSYWIAAVPDDVLEKPYRYPTDFGRNLHVLPGEKASVSPPEAGVWTEVKIAVIDCPREGNLRIGITHGNGQPFQSNFYIDDIKMYEPEYVLIKFDTNGSEDVFEDVTILSEMTIPYGGVDPYREGYEFLGWYTSKEYNKDAYFDIYNTPVVGKTGDVLTLYAHWRKWDENVAQGGNREDKYKTEYYTEKVWIGDQNVPENPYPSGEFNVNEADPIVTTPDDATPDDDGIPPWLIVVIIVAAVVVVGGGAALAAILLKKKKA